MIKINKQEIKNFGEPFIVAEAGINHNGNIDLAFEMIKLAKKVGANAIKFQTFKAEDFISDSKQTYTYKSNGKEITESMLNMFKRYEFSRDNWIKIKKMCDNQNIIFLSTPQNYSDLEFLMELEIEAIKIGSDDFTNIPLLKQYSSTGLPLILSCGMSNLAEIYTSLDCIKAFEGYPTVLLLCTSQYPTPAEDVNIMKLKTLRDSFPMIEIGFSDHTQGALASSLAVTFGACFFEKHFTLDNNLEGPDHWFSENPNSLKLWVDSIKTSYKMLGSAILKPTKKEEEMKILARRSLVAINYIEKDQIITDKNLGLKRPGNGLNSSYYSDIIGKKASKIIQKNTLVLLGDFY